MYNQVSMNDICKSYTSWSFILHKRFWYLGLSYVINPTTRAQNYISYLNQKPAKYEFSCKQSRLSEKQNTCTKNVWTMVEKYLGWQGPDREPHKIEIVIKKNKSL